MPSSAPRIFISHSSADETLATKLVDLITGCMTVTEGELLCTSVPGHQLELGSDAPTVLRETIQGATCFIALITPDALRSQWVMFELGAAWMLEKQKAGAVVPLLFPGLSPKAVLPEVIRNSTGMPLNDRRRLPGLMRRVSELAGLREAHADAVARRIEVFSAFVSELPAASDNQGKDSVPALADDASAKVREVVYRYAHDASAPSEDAHALVRIGPPRLVLPALFRHELSSVRDALPWPGTDITESVVRADVFALLNAEVAEIWPAEVEAQVVSEIESRVRSWAGRGRGLRPGEVAASMSLLEATLHGLVGDRRRDILTRIIDGTPGAEAVVHPYLAPDAAPSTSPVHAASPPTPRVDRAPPQVERFRMPRHGLQKAPYLSTAWWERTPDGEELRVRAHPEAVGSTYLDTFVAGTVLRDRGGWAWRAILPVASVSLGESIAPNQAAARARILDLLEEQASGFKAFLDATGSPPP